MLGFKKSLFILRENVRQSGKKRKTRHREKNNNFLIKLSKKLLKQGAMVVV